MSKSNKAKPSHSVVKVENVELLTSPSEIIRHFGLPDLMLDEGAQMAPERYGQELARKAVQKALGSVRI